MALTLPQQILELVRRSSHILVAFAKDGGVDALAAALATARTLRAENKTVEVVSRAFNSANHAFLADADTIQNTLPSLQKLIVEINTQRAPVEEISYDVKEGTLRVYVTPKTGMIPKEEVRLKSSPWRYDLIVVVGSPDCESLGTVYTEHKDLFANVPILNIDHSPENEQFGQVNMVELNACSTAEVVLTFREALGQRDLDPDIATILLAGMIAATKNFKVPRVTHKTLEIAAQLFAAGARREEIVTHMQRTRTLETLKLWGEVFSSLRHDAALKLVWAVVPREVFARSGATETALHGIADEILLHSPEANVVALFIERAHGEGVHAFVAVNEPHSARALIAPYGPDGTAHVASVTINAKELIAAEKELIEHIKKSLETKV